jgi:Putative adhesin
MKRAFWMLAGLYLALVPLARGEEWTKTFSLSGSPDLRVETSDANIRVDTWDQKTIEAKVTSEKWGVGQGKNVEVYDHQTGDAVEIEVRLPQHFSVLSIGVRRVEIEIHMPREGKLHLNTGDGSIELKNFKGDMDLTSGDGNENILDVEGALRAHSGDGHIEVRGRFDGLDLSTSDGHIDARAQSGSTVGEGWNLKTGDGRVTLGLPPNFAADVDLHTGDGHIVLDIPVSVEGKYESSRIRGKINGGGGMVTIHTGDGSIRLEKVSASI